MKLFLYEAVCAGALPAQPASLVAEGRAMLAALAQDFAGLPDVRVTTLLSPSVANRERLFGECTSKIEAISRNSEPEKIQIHKLASAADYTLVIAPEFKKMLADRSRWVLEGGGRLLGSTPDGVALASDKWALSRLWLKEGVPTPRCLVAEDRPRVRFPLVLKPRDGAGSQGVVLVRTEAKFATAIETARSFGSEILQQEFVSGTPCSVSFLIGPKQTLELMPASQEVSPDGAFRYLGGTVPLTPEALAERATRLARRAIEVIPGLVGYCGVDLILGPEPDGSGDQVIEVNPRLTTSYIGLRQLARDNLGRLMLGIVRGDPVMAPEWKDESIRFAPDGTFSLGGNPQWS